MTEQEVPQETGEQKLARLEQENEAMRKFITDNNPQPGQPGEAALPPNEPMPQGAQLLQLAAPLLKEFIAPPAQPDPFHQLGVYMTQATFRKFLKKGFAPDPEDVE